MTQTVSKDLLTAINQGNVRKFYKSGEWRKKRKDILERDNKECQVCKEDGRVSTANTVHHIKHLTDRPELGLVDSNLKSVCSACHNLLHPERMLTVKRREVQVINEERW